MSAISAMLSPTVILSEVRVNARASRRTPAQPMVTMPIQGALPKHFLAYSIPHTSSWLTEIHLCRQTIQGIASAPLEWKESNEIAHTVYALHVGPLRDALGAAERRPRPRKKASCTPA